MGKKIRNFTLISKWGKLTLLLAPIKSHAEKTLLRKTY
jgi:hypothetical protein